MKVKSRWRLFQNYLQRISGSFPRILAIFCENRFRIRIWIKWSCNWRGIISEINQNRGQVPRHRRLRMAEMGTEAVNSNWVDISQLWLRRSLTTCHRNQWWHVAERMGQRHSVCKRSLHWIMNIPSCSHLQRSRAHKMKLAWTRWRSQLSNNHPWILVLELRRFQLRRRWMIFLKSTENQHHTKNSYRRDQTQETYLPANNLWMMKHTYSILRRTSGQDFLTNNKSKWTTT